MQEKLTKHSSQVDLLKESLNLQKDMVTMMSSMLEGNVINGTIRKRIVDTLVESACNVEISHKCCQELTAFKINYQCIFKSNYYLFCKITSQDIDVNQEIQCRLQCYERNHDGEID